MENKSHALAAGLFVVFLTAMVIGLSMWMGRDNTKYDYYEMSTRASISGLQEQAAVRYKGVAVGRVTRIGFDPKKDGNVLIRIAVNEHAPLSQTTYAMLGYQGVTGLAHIQLDDDETPGAPLPPSEDGTPRLALRPSPFGQIAEQGPVIMQQVEDATRRVNQLLGDENQREITAALHSVGEAARSMQALSARLQATVDTKLDPALAALPAVAQDARKTLLAVQKTSEDVGKAVGSLSAQGGPVQQMGTAVQGVSDAADAFGRGTVPTMNRALNDMGSAARRLGGMADSLQSNPQSLLYGAGGSQPGPGEPGFVPPQPAIAPGAKP